MQPLSATDPRTAGEFTLRARLGAGGMGRVYLGYSPAGRAVAVKVVHPDLARDEEFLARFRNEVAAARAVSGLYTAPVVAAGLGDSPPWLATVYVPGPALDGVVSKAGPLPEAAVWRLAAGLSEALQAVHASGLVHRDLKPSNVLLAGDGPHVIDFGISRAMGGTHLTATGMVVGTPGYMSPEQAEGNEAGTPSDVFSLACVVAYASTGKQPFGSGSAASVLYRVVAGQPDLDGIPRSLRDVLEACLRKDPAQRPLLPDVAAAFSRGAGMLGDGMGSPTSFWPPAIAEVIRASVEGAPASTGVPASPVPHSPVPQSPVPYSPVPQSPVPQSQFGQASYSGHSQFAQPQPAAFTQSGPPSYQPAAYQPPSYVTPPAPQPPGFQAPPPYQQAGPGTGYATPQGPYQPSVRQPVLPQGPIWPQTPPGTMPPAGPGPGQPGMVGPHAFRPARRKPARAELPPPVSAALSVMYVGAAVTGISLVISIVDMVRLDKIATTTLSGSTDNWATTSLGFLVIFALIGGVIGLIMWLVCAGGVRRGRRWGAITGTVFFGLDTLSMLFVLLGARDAAASKVLSVVIWALGLTAIILAWNPRAQAFYKAFR